MKRYSDKEIARLLDEVSGDRSRDIVPIVPENDVEERMLMRSLLNCVDNDIVAYAIYKVFGVGHKPTRAQFGKVNRFRFSDKAQVLYGLWTGKDYEPKAIRQSATRSQRNSSNVLVYRLPSAPDGMVWSEEAIKVYKPKSDHIANPVLQAKLPKLLVNAIPRSELK